MNAKSGSGVHGCLMVKWFASLRRYLMSDKLALFYFVLLCFVVPTIIFFVVGEVWSLIYLSLLGVGFMFSR